MIRQLRELSRSEPSCLKYETLDAELDTTGFLFLEPGNDDYLFSSTFESQVLFVSSTSVFFLLVSSAGRSLNFFKKNQFFFF